MKKPTNRKERMALIVQKLGSDFARDMYSLSDSEVKDFFNLRYKKLKDMHDYNTSLQSHNCIRCNEEVSTEFHTFCGCGTDRAIYNAEMWVRDIEDFDESDRLEEDIKFINNGYKINKE